MLGPNPLLLLALVLTVAGCKEPSCGDLAIRGELGPGRLGVRYEGMLAAVGAVGDVVWTVGGTNGIRVEGRRVFGIPDRAGPQTWEITARDDCAEATRAFDVDVAPSPWLAHTYQTPILPGSPDGSSPTAGFDLIDVSGPTPSDPVPLYTPADDIFGDGVTEVHWAANGSKLLYRVVFDRRHSPRQGDIRFVDLSSGAPEAPVELVSGQDLRDAALSPDGRWLTYRIDSDAGTRRLIVDTDSESLRSETLPVESCEGFRWGELWSADSRFLVAVKRLDGSSREDLCVFDMSGSDPAEVTSPDIPGLDSGFPGSEPSFGPFGARLLLPRALGTECGFYLADLNGESGPVDLGVRFDSHCPEYQWAADGRSVVVYDRFRLVRIQLEGEPVVRQVDIDPDAMIRHLVQSRDGGLLAYFKERRTIQLLRWDDEPLRAIPISNDAEPWGLWLSPDQRWLAIVFRTAFYEWTLGNAIFELWIADLNEAEPTATRLSFENGTVHFGDVEFAPDSSSVIFVDPGIWEDAPDPWPHPGTEGQWIVDLRGDAPSAPVFLGEEPPNEHCGRVGSFRFNADGSRIAMGCGSPSQTYVGTYEGAVGPLVRLPGLEGRTYWPR